MRADIETLIAETKAAHEAQSGADRLWGWFSLSRASFLVLPRVLMHEMPDDWQKRMAVLLEEYEEAFPNQPDIGTRVQCTKAGRLVPWADWVLNYRRPDRDAIDRMRAKQGSML